MSAKEFHVAWAEAPTITCLEIVGRENEPGLAIYDSSYEEVVCPIKEFRYPHDLCWDIIREVLDA